MRETINNVEPVRLQSNFSTILLMVVLDLARDGIPLTTENVARRLGMPVQMLRGWYEILPIMKHVGPE